MTREAHTNRGRITTLIQSGKLFEDLHVAPLTPSSDRVMVCGSAAMLDDTCALLDARGFELSPSIGTPGDCVVERAFVTR